MKALKYFDSILIVNLDFMLSMCPLPILLVQNSTK
jgi:hypothetical protein